MENRFNFDRQLWSRFIKIAQPYWYPRERKATGFFGLLGILLIAVVIVTFFLLIAGTVMGRTIVPGFFENVAAGLSNQVDHYLGNTVLLVAAAIGLVICLRTFISRKDALIPRWRQWSILALLLFLAFVVTGANVSISFIFRFIDTALNQKEEPIFWRYLFIYAGLIVTAIPILVLYRYTRLKLGLLWRDWLTRQFLDRYFSHRAYYELDSNAANSEIDNPDQRITEDIRSFTRVTLSFLLDVLNSVLDLISFTLLLYTISKALTVGLIIYALVGTSIALIAGRRLIKYNFDQLRLEADFRYGMVHIRDNAESIAFYRGEQLEFRQVVDRLIKAIRNFDRLILWQAIIDLFQYAYNYFTRIVPYAIIAPLYFAGETDFGTIGQATFAFGQVLSALSIITNQIQQISEFAAGVNRLGAFDEVLDDPARSWREDNQHIQTTIDQLVALHSVTLLTPNSEQRLVAELSVTLGSSEPLLIVGPSGAGKSSILRAVAGLWTNGMGTIQRPDIDQMLFLPQKPYMLLGSLRDQLLYPTNPTDFSEQDLEQILEEVNLGSLRERVSSFDDFRDWPNILSLGEQQRLAFARLLVTKPAYAILDEATSALDIANEQRLYEKLQAMGTSYISVGHRASLLKYHPKVLELLGEAEWRILSNDEYAELAELAS